MNIQAHLATTPSTMKNTFLIISLIALRFSVFAQDQPDFKNDIGFSTNFVIGQLFQYSQAPFSVMYKKYTTQTGAFRIGFDASIHISDGRGNNNPGHNYSDNSNISFSLILGREFQKRISRNWMWYWGLDIAPTYSKNSLESFRNTEKIYTYDGTDYSLSIKPLAGVRYNINDRLYLSAEANASLASRVFENETVRYESEVTTQHINGTEIRFDFIPASGLSIFYRF